jgi:hypothetical protein
MRLKLSTAVLLLLTAASVNSQGNCDKNSPFAFCRAMATDSPVHPVQGIPKSVAQEVPDRIIRGPFPT